MYGTVNSVKGIDAEDLKMPPYSKDEYVLSSEIGFIFLQNAHFTLKPASQKNEIPYLTNIVLDELVIG
jgi:hypothetical protein